MGHCFAERLNSLAPVQVAQQDDLTVSPHGSSFLEVVWLGTSTSHLKKINVDKCRKYNQQTNTER